MEMVWISCPGGTKILPELPGIRVSNHPMRVARTPGITEAIRLGTITEHKPAEVSELPAPPSGPDRIAGIGHLLSDERFMAPPDDL